MLYINRELSWLKFNARVLEEAQRKTNPLCERLNFAAIYQSNLDEFFMVRVGSLVDQMIVSESVVENKTQMTPSEQIDEILKEVTILNEKKDQIYKELLDEIKPYGVRFVDFHTIDPQEEAQLEQYFDMNIAPLLSPIIVGKRQPFPFLKNKDIYCVVVLEKKNSKEKLGIIPCGTGAFSRLIKVPNENGVYVLSERLILHFVSKVFQGYTVASKSLIRVTRSADIDSDALYDEDLDYRDFMEEIIRQRKRLNPVRLEFSREMDDKLINALCEYTEADPKKVFRCHSPLDLSFLYQVQDILRNIPELFYAKEKPQKASWYKPNESILAQIQQGDKLLSYPFESIKPFLEMLREAAEDPAVLSIRMTLYRVASNSEVIEHLIEAAENGKEVLVLVELKARFDEENNIEWSRQLEDAGCQVIYGLEGYKVHSKLCLITRRENGQLTYFTQIGTGNYNEKTARLYTDLSLLTANTEIGLEAASVFRSLATGQIPGTFKNLLVAPNSLQNRIVNMIDDQIQLAKAGQPSYIGFKMNSLTDKTIMKKLIEASESGVKIDLVVRGICCLKPGVEGKTDNIRVVSIVGRFLEHSRIYIFGVDASRKIYIGSADMMTRNTLRRVEVAVPILDEGIKKRLWNMFETMLFDNQQATQLLSTGEYVRVVYGEKPVNSQEQFYQEAKQAAYSIPKQIVQDNTTTIQVQPKLETNSRLLDLKKKIRLILRKKG